MARVFSLNKKCEKVVRRSGDLIFIRSKKDKNRPFNEQIHVSISKGKKGWSLQRTGGEKGFDNNPTGTYWGFNKKNQEVGYLTKEKAIKESVRWLKQRGEC